MTIHFELSSRFRDGFLIIARAVGFDKLEKNFDCQLFFVDTSTDLLVSIESVRSMIAVENDLYSAGVEIVKKGFDSTPYFLILGPYGITVRVGFSSPQLWVS